DSIVNITSVGDQEYSDVRTKINVSAAKTNGGKKLAELSNGNFINIWENQADSFSSQIMARIFSPDGGAVTNEIQIDQSFFSLNVQPAITSLSSGGFAVTWKVVSDGGDDNIKLRFFDNSGLPTSAEILISDASVKLSTGGTSDYNSPDIAQLANGNIVISYDGMTENIPGGIGWGISAAILSSTGDILKNQFQVHDETHKNEYEPAVIAFDNGNFGIVFEKKGTLWDVQGKIYEADGGVIQNEVSLHSSGQHYAPDITSLSNNRALATWHAIGSNRGVYVRLFDGSLTALTEQVRVDTSTDAQYYPTAIELNDGSFLVAWKASDGSDYGVYAQRLDSNLQAVGDVFRLNQTTSGKQEDIKLMAYGETGFIASWTSENQDGDGNAIVQRLFSTQETITNSITETTNAEVPAISLTNHSNAQNALTRLDTALQTINSQRAELGSLSNRLDHIIANNTNASTNTKASLGRIQDADFAAETTKLAKSKILEQSSTAMLAQANASVYEVLTLIPD
ncbi:flagellin, partial [Paracoccaceae bacterium]|nr:flagellin [Paracoccaceae bacterium]